MAKGDGLAFTGNSMTPHRLFLTALALAALIGVSPLAAQTMSGSLDPDAFATALSAFGSAEVLRTDDSVTLVGSIASKSGTDLAYRGPFASCLDGKACGNLSLRYVWTGGDQVQCILNAWQDRYAGENRAKPLYAFDEIRLIQETFAYGDVRVDAALIATNWQRDVLAFDALTRQANRLCP